MNYKEKTKEQIIIELNELKQKLEQLTKNSTDEFQQEISPFLNEDLFHAINKATTELLVNNSLHEAIQIGLAIIGQALKLDRVYIFENFYNYTEIGSVSILKSEWNSNTTNVQFNNPVLKNIPFVEIDILMETLEKGDTFAQIVSEMEPCKTKISLQQQGILSTIAMPIFIDEICWGFIGFDECKFERKWADSEISLLKTFVNSVARTIERSKFEQKLIESEERYRRITDSLTDYLYTVIVENGKAVKTLHNYACLAVTGYTPLEFNNDPYLWINMVVPEEREQIANRFSEILAGKELQNSIEHRIICKNGKIKWVKDTTIPKYDEKGQIVSYDGVIKDITDIKLSEKELIASEAKFRTFFEQSPVGTIIVGLDKRIIKCNLAFCNFLAFTENELIGKTIQDITHPEDIKIGMEELKLILEGKLESSTLQKRYLRKDGIVVWGEISIRLVRDANHQPLYFLPIIQDITERIQAEEALRENEQKYRLIAENTTDVIWKFNIESQKFTYISPSIIHLTGYTVEEAIQQKIEETLSEESADLAIQGLKKRIENFYAGELSEKTKVNEFVQICKDGSRIWVEISSTFVFNDKGKITDLIGISRNIQQRKKNEKKLAKSKNRYKKISRLSSDFAYSCVHGQNGYEIDWITDAFYSITGYTKQELYEQKCWFFVAHPNDRIEAVAKLNQMSIAEHVQMEFRIISKDGAEHTIINRMECLSDDELPSRKRIFGAVQDITEQKQMEDALRESERFLKETQLIANLGTYTMDIVSGKWESSEVLDNIFGIDSDFEKNLQGWASIIHPDWQKIIPEYFIQEVIANKNKFDKEYKIIRKNDKAECWVHGIGNLKFNEKREPITMVGTIRDITQQKKAEEKLKANENILIELNADKDRFISILAHDLKNPFSSMLGFLGLLSKNVRKYDIDKIENQIKIINNTAQHTFNLLESILMWAKSQSGKIPFDPQYLNFTSVYNKAIGSLLLNANSKKITINNNVKEEIKVFADMDMLSTIIRNLVSNAIKFTNSGGQIDIDARTCQKEIEITVSDNGVGIEPENLSKLFDYSQKYTSLGTNQEKGTGLGLVLCKEFIEKHGGKIWVESIVGKGCKFNFNLLNSQTL